ncbi:MAG: protein kinase [Waddliaceae bacterium]|jgi:serine/threonine protein kinase|nr:protein kinase [Waddliaceae bacterium]
MLPLRRPSAGCHDIASQRERIEKIEKFFGANYDIVYHNRTKSLFSSNPPDAYLFPKDPDEITKYRLGEGSYALVDRVRCVPANVTPKSIVDSRIQEVAVKRFVPTSGDKALGDSKPSTSKRRFFKSIKNVASRIFNSKKTITSRQCRDHEWKVLKRLKSGNRESTAAPLLPIACLDIPGKGTVSTTPALVFPLMDTDLSKYLCVNHLRSRMLKRKLPLYEVQDLGKQLLEQVASAHSCGVHHRDLKPENLLLKYDRTTKRYILKTTDFGTAIYKGPPPLFRQHSLSNRGYIQSRWYRAPEVILTPGPFTEKVDIWSVALVLIELACGNPFFTRRRL